MKKMALIFSVLFILSLGSLFATVLLTDDFTGTGNLTANGWTAHSSGGTNPWVITTPSQTYTGYSSSGVGNTAQTGNTSGEDINKAVTATSSGSVYAAFMVKVLTTSTTGDYVLHFAPLAGSSIGSTFNARFFINRDASNNVRFGLAKTTTYNYTGYSYALGTTYLVVIKYTFNTGSTTNDALYLFVNPTLGGSEPTPTISITTDTSTDATSIQSICLRQGTAGNTTTEQIDGIQIATAWSDIFPISASISVTGSFTPFTTTVGTPSTSQSVAVSGSNLTNNIDVAALSGYEYSTDNSNWYSSLSLSPSYNGNVWVRLTGATQGSYSGNVSFTSSPATQVDKAVSGNVNPLTPIINVTGTFNAFSTTTGTPSVYQTVVVSGANLSANIDVSAVTGYEYSTDGSNWYSSLSLASSYSGNVHVRLTGAALGTYDGTISFSSTGATTVDKAVTGSVTAPPPVINVTGTLSAFTTVAGTPSAEQSYSLSGSNLTADLIVTAPTGYEISTTSGGGFTSQLTLSSSFSGFIYVHLNSTAGTFTGNITHTSTGATSVNQPVTGTITLPNTPMNIEAGQTLTQDFDSIGKTAMAPLPTDWKADKQTVVRTLGTYAAAVTATEQYAGNSMSSSATNGIYNYGAGVYNAATDRAVGFVSSSSATKSGNLYTKVTNTGTSNITQFDISYDVEKYREGTNAAGYQVQMYYSTDGSTWTSAGLDFNSSWPADAATQGYTSAPGDVQPAVGTVALTIAPSASVYFCWNYSVISGTTTSYAQALGIDNVSIKAQNEYTLPVELSSFTAVSSTSQLLVTLQWTTESETNNLGFNILRSDDPNIAHAINLNGNIITGTNTSTAHTYNYQDETVEAPHSYYYWLENVDFTGYSRFNGPVIVNVLEQGDPDTPPVTPGAVTKLNGAYPNPFNPQTIISYDLKNESDVLIQVFNINGQLIKTLVNRHQQANHYTVAWLGNDEQGRPVGSGIYLYRMVAGKYTSTQKVVLMK